MILLFHMRIAHEVKRRKHLNMIQVDNLVGQISVNQKSTSNIQHLRSIFCHIHQPLTIPAIYLFRRLWPSATNCFLACSSQYQMCSLNYTYQIGIIVDQNYSLLAVRLGNSMAKRSVTVERNWECGQKYQLYIDATNKSYSREFLLFGSQLTSKMLAETIENRNVEVHLFTFSHHCLGRYFSLVAFVRLLSVGIFAHSFAELCTLSEIEMDFVFASLIFECHIEIYEKNSLHQL